MQVTAQLAAVSRAGRGSTLGATTDAEARAIAEPVATIRHGLDSGPVAILAVLRSATRQVGARLMDAVDPDRVDQATAAVTSVPGIDHIQELRIRWIGHTLRAEVDITVPADLDITQAHDLAHHAEAHPLARVPRLTAATVHASRAAAHHQPNRQRPSHT